MNRKDFIHGKYMDGIFVSQNGAPRRLATVYVTTGEFFVFSTCYAMCVTSVDDNTKQYMK
jgi:hypothetical protein